jgi:hypothetical protein
VKRWITFVLPGLLVALALPVAAMARTDAGSGDRTLFIRSAVEQPGNKVTLPLYRGTSKGQTVWFIVLDASSSNAADRFGVNKAQKLENARGTAAVQKVHLAANGEIVFPGTVDFAPVREVGGGFPPSPAHPGAVGDADYSPLIELPDGTVLNAPQIANATGRADKVVSLDTVNRRVTYLETDGFARGKAVKYVSTDASDELAATLEDVTLAPRLNAAPFAGGDGTDSARASLAAFLNGQTGAGNPNRQGLNSAVADGLDPLNLLAWNPTQGRYSPLWDVHLAVWTVPTEQRIRQVEFAAVEDLAEKGLVTGPGGAFGPAGFIVNCPIVSQS